MTLSRRAQFLLAARAPDRFLPQSLLQPHGGKPGGGDGEPDPRPDPRIAAVSLIVPTGVVFTAESLARVRIPVAVTLADSDEVLVPRWHGGHVLRHCTACRELPRLADAGHFDVLWPWPDEVARQVAATQMRGGLPSGTFSAARRQAAFDAIAGFFEVLNRP
jgi:hypothetical protein